MSSHLHHSDYPLGRAVPARTNKGFGSGIVVGVLGAVIGGLLLIPATQEVNWLEKVRQDRATELNDRLEKLYKPLKASSEFNETRWKIFTRTAWRADDVRDPKHPQVHIFFSDDKPPTQSEVQKFRAWQHQTFEPHNLEQKEIITKNKDLMPGSQVPAVFEEAAQYAEDLNNLLPEWDKEEKSGLIETAADFNVPKEPYPAGMGQCLTEEIGVLESIKRNLDRSWWPWGGPPQFRLRPQFDLPRQAVPSCTKVTQRTDYRLRSFPGRND
jgi:hypothetical protein